MNMSSLFGLSTPVDIDIRFNGQEQRKQIEAKVDKDRRDKFPLYFDGETVAGKINIRVKDGKKIEHNEGDSEETKQKREIQDISQVR
ncbi:hypothetical protein BGZ82_007520 [Podila clonocystis]|nr:hypothetical protein BGZ82_007520 [Podila clonocystis]